MTVKPKPLTVRIKRGDDFRLSMAVKDRRSDAAAIAYETYQAAHEAWRAAVNADPPVELDIQNTQDTMEGALEAYETACEVDITNWEIKGAFAWNTRPVGIITCVIEDASRGIYTISIGRDITYWLKPKEYRAEIQFTRPTGSDTEVTTTQDFILVVDADIVDSEDINTMDPPPLVIPGPQGPPGPEGPSGPQGIQGVPGQDGADGADGADGISYNPLTTITSNANPFILTNDHFIGNVQIYLTAANCEIRIPVGLTNMEPVAIIQMGSGQAFVTAVNSGITTLLTGYGLNFAGQYAVCGLMKSAPETYVFLGDTVE